MNNITLCITEINEDIDIYEHVTSVHITGSDNPVIDIRWHDPRTDRSGDNQVALEDIDSITIKPNQ